MAPRDSRACDRLRRRNLLIRGWGLAERFVDRMASAGGVVFIVGPAGEDLLTGIDGADGVACLPNGYSGDILTNDIETTAALLRARR
jgi:hypothetical protein